MRLSIKQQNLKLKRPISRIVMENELQTKHHKKCNLKKAKSNLFSATTTVTNTSIHNCTPSDKFGNMQ